MTTTTSAHVCGTDEKLRLLLETVVPSNFVSCPWSKCSHPFTLASLADDKYLADTRMYLAISAEMSQAELIGKTPYLIKICSASHIEHLVRQALPGVALTHVARRQHDPDQTGVSVFQPEPIRSGLGCVGRARIWRYIPANSPRPGRIDYPAAEPPVSPLSRAG